jgi:hypothetical protein
MKSICYTVDNSNGTSFAIYLHERDKKAMKREGKRQGWQYPSWFPLLFWQLGCEGERK